SRNQQHADSAARRKDRGRAERANRERGRNVAGGSAEDFAAHFSNARENRGRALRASRSHQHQGDNKRGPWRNWPRRRHGGDGGRKRGGGVSLPFRLSC